MSFKKTLFVLFFSLIGFFSRSIFAFYCDNTETWILSKKAAFIGFDKTRKFCIEGQSLNWYNIEQNKLIAGQKISEMNLNKIRREEKNKVKYVHIPLLKKSRGRTTLILFECKKK